MYNCPLVQCTASVLITSKTSDWILGFVDFWWTNNSEASFCAFTLNISRDAVKSELHSLVKNIFTVGIHCGESLFACTTTLSSEDNSTQVRTRTGGAAARGRGWVYGLILNLGNCHPTSRLSQTHLRTLPRHCRWAVVNFENIMHFFKIRTVTRVLPGSGQDRAM